MNTVSADISLGKPAARGVDSQNVYHSDLLASNAVLAVLKEIRTVPVVSLETATPTTAEIAIFEVKQNLAHRRYDRMGDGALQPGKLFPVSLASDVPGQDAALSDTLRAMKPGDEAVMNIDHIYIFREEGNENVRACTRFAKVEPRDAAPDTPRTPDAATTPAPPAEAQPTAPTAPPAALADDSSSSSGYARSVETSISIRPDGKGGYRQTKVEIQREQTPEGVKIRKFINDVEVDPTTDQPLAPATPPAPQAQPATQPEAQPAAQPQQSEELPPIPNPPEGF